MVKPLLITKKKIAETFNNFVSNIVKNLNIDSDLSDITSQAS